MPHQLPRFQLEVLSLVLYLLVEQQTELFSRYPTVQLGAGILLGVIAIDLFWQAWNMWVTDKE